MSPFSSWAPNSLKSSMGLRRFSLIPDAGHQGGQVALWSPGEVKAQHPPGIVQGPRILIGAPTSCLRHTEAPQTFFQDQWVPMFRKTNPNYQTGRGSKVPYTDWVVRTLRKSGHPLPSAPEPAVSPCPRPCVLPLLHSVLVLSLPGGKRHLPTPGSDSCKGGAGGGLESRESSPDPQTHSCL